MKKEENKKSRWDIEAEQNKKMTRAAIDFLKKCKDEKLTLTEIEEITRITIVIAKRNTNLASGFDI